MYCIDSDKVFDELLELLKVQASVAIGIVALKQKVKNRAVRVIFSVDGNVIFIVFGEFLIDLLFGHQPVLENNQNFS